MEHTEHLQHLILRHIPQVQIISTFTRRGCWGELLLIWEVDVILVQPPDRLFVIVEKLSECECYSQRHIQRIGAPLGCLASCARCTHTE